MMRIKARKLQKSVFLSIIIMAALISVFLHAGEQAIVQKNEALPESNKLVIDLSQGISSSLKVEPKKQYLIYLKGAHLSNDEQAILIGTYYDYKKGKYSRAFVLRELVKEDDKSVFTLYTEIETYGYYSIRFFKLAKKDEENLRCLLKDIDKGEKDPSTVIPTCFAGARLYLEGIKPPDIVQFDFGWAMLFNPQKSKIDGPTHFFLLNAYPGAWLMSYKRAVRDVLLSKISVSLGLGLSKSEEGSKNWFLGITIPAVYDFSGVVGINWQSGNSGNIKFAIGVKIGPELFTKAIEAMKLTKVPEF